MSTPPRNLRKIRNATRVGNPGLGRVRIAPEAIAVIDMVGSTAKSDLFGWYPVGRPLFRELRQLILEIGANYGLSCIKSTGDGFLLTYHNGKSAELAAVGALDASFELLRRLAARNSGKIPEEREIWIRVAIHFGDVDILQSDREGPNVSYAFRIEAIGPESLAGAISAIDASKFPLRHYLICSERVSGMLAIIKKRLFLDMRPMAEAVREV